MQVKRLLNSCTSLCLGLHAHQAECCQRCRGHALPVWDVAFSPLAPYMATASADHTAHVWSTERASPLRILTGARLYTLSASLV